MSEQMTRRQVYAFVALTDLPPLESVSFVNTNGLHLDVGDNVDPTPWLLLLGADPGQVRRQRYDNATGDVDKHGFILTMFFQWRGWQMHVRAFIDDGQSDPMDVLDEQTVEQLQAVAAGDPPTTAFVRGNALLVDQALTPPADGPLTVLAALAEQKDCAGCDCYTAAPRDPDDPGAYPGPDPDCDCPCHETGVTL